MMNFTRRLSIPSSPGLPASRRVPLALLILVVIGSTTGLAATSYAVFSSSIDSSDAIVVTPNRSRSDMVQAAEDPWNGQRPTAALVTLTPRGFEPARLTLPAGRLLLMVDNQSGLAGDVKLQLNLETRGELTPMLLKPDVRDMGAGQPQVHLPREKVNWRNLIDLLPGNYLLTEADHPLWSCQITVTVP